MNYLVEKLREKFTSPQEVLRKLELDEGLVSDRADSEIKSGVTQINPQDEYMKKGLYTRAALLKLAQDADVEAVGKLLELLEDEVKEPEGMSEDAIDLSGATPEQLEAIKRILNPSAEDEDPDKKEDEEDDDKVDKQAMDAAIAAAKAETVAVMRGINEALKVVHPYVGDIMAQDSAEAVYGEALRLMNVEVEGVHPSAFKAILLAQPKPGAKEEIAMDAKSGEDFYALFPGAKNIKRG